MIDLSSLTKISLSVLAGTFLASLFFISTNNELVHISDSMQNKVHAITISETSPGILEFKTDNSAIREINDGRLYLEFESQTSNHSGMIPITKRDLQLGVPLHGFKMLDQYQFSIVNEIAGYRTEVATTTYSVNSGLPGFPEPRLVKRDQSGVELSWDEVASNGAMITDYEIYYREIGSLTWIRYEDGISTLRSATVPLSFDEKSIEFQVLAKNSSGVSAQAWDVVDTDMNGDRECFVKIDGSLWCAGFSYATHPNEFLLGPISGNSNRFIEKVNGIEGAKQVTVGGSSVCVLLLEGSVKCWGSNTQGELGDGTTISKYVPTQVSILTDIVRIFNGTNETCAIDSVGDLFCWGPRTNSLVPIPISVGGQVVLGDGASGHACVVLTTGAAKCWGGNYFGQLGDGTFQDKSTPQLVSGLSDISTISVGFYHTCATTKSGEVYCWGDNRKGQLGVSMSSYGYSHIPRQVTVAGFAQNIQLGGSSSCVLNAAGSVYCWGNNREYGNLGNNNEELSSTPLLAADNIASFTSNTYGKFCGIANSFDYVCWGHVPQITPIDIEEFNLATHISAGFLKTCAVTTNGFTGCIGPPKTSFSGTSGAKEIYVGHNHECALMNNGQVLCQGDNQYGQIGDNTTTFRATPTAVFGIVDATFLSVGAYNNCAIRSSGEIWCWGQRDSWNIAKKPFFQGSTSGLSSISQGGMSSCWVYTSGRAQCFGPNYNGQLGTGDCTSGSCLVYGLEDAIKISRSYGAACALRDQGKVSCWGAITSTNVPVEINGLTNIQDLSTTETHACAILNTSEVACWGSGRWLGTGNDNRQWIDPTIVKGLVGVTAISVGPYRNCAILESGRTLCWGFWPSTAGSYSLVSERTLKVHPTKPLPPSSIQVEKSTASISLNWGEPFNGGSAILGYSVRYRLASSATWIDVPSQLLLGTTLTLENLEPNNSYVLQIGARNRYGFVWSDEIPVTLDGFSVTSILPLSVSRGSAIDVSGLALSLVSEVRIGSLVVPFRFVSDSLIVVTVPTAATSGNLRLLSSSQDVVAGALTVSTSTVAPTITAVEPYVAVPGAVVTVRGNNVGAASDVKVGATSVPFSVTGRGSFTITLGSNLVNGKVQVTTPGGSVTSSGTLVVPPRITTSTLRAGVGVLVSLTGENLVDVTSISVGGKTVTPSSKTATSVSFTIPTGVVTGSGTVTGPGGLSNSFTFQLLNPPTLNTFTLSAKIGDTITLTGTNLMNVTGVRVGTTAATSFSSTDTTVTFVVPTGATNNKVTFSGAAGTVTSASTLTVAQPPRITSLSPTRGRVGSTVTINGTNLSNATVTFGTRAATKSSNTATQIKVKVPTGLAKGVVTIRVVTANGEATISFTVT